MSDNQTTGLVESAIPVCPRCKRRLLWGRCEQEYSICNRCADVEYERYQERAEWEYYHRG